MLSPEGRAISELGRQSRYAASMAGLSDLVKRMEADGELRVERAGARAVAVHLGPNAQAALAEIDAAGLAVRGEPEGSVTRAAAGPLRRRRTRQHPRP